jgi:FK506-binding protein 2
VIVNTGGLGIELVDQSRYIGELRVAVKRLVPGGPADKGRVISPLDILVSVNGETLETATAARAQEIISKAPRPLALVFRKPAAFSELLQPPMSPSAAREGGGDDEARPTVVTTQVAPAIEGNGNRAQVVSVERLSTPAMCTQGAAKGDLLEITYIGRLAADGKVFDGSSAKVNGKDLVGRGGDPTLFFVLGQQPTGQFPPGWDVGLVGMCVGEERRLTVPAVLAFGRQGLPRRQIPPDADLVYDVKLVSSNGDAQPR